MRTPPAIRIYLQTGTPVTELPPQLSARGTPPPRTGPRHRSLHGRPPLTARRHLRLVARPRPGFLWRLSGRGDQQPAERAGRPPGSRRRGERCRLTAARFNARSAGGVSDPLPASSATWPSTPRHGSAGSAASSSGKESITGAENTIMPWMLEFLKLTTRFHNARQTRIRRGWQWQKSVRLVTEHVGFGGV